MTAAAIDRLIHHSNMIEFAGPNYRQPVAEAPSIGKAEVTIDNQTAATRPPSAKVIVAIQPRDNYGCTSTTHRRQLKIIVADGKLLHNAKCRDTSMTFFGGVSYR
jgi:hypothetical protein